jgi:hypothetical protein
MTRPAPVSISRWTFLFAVMLIIATFSTGTIDRVCDPSIHAEEFMGKSRSISECSRDRIRMWLKLEEVLGSSPEG